MDLICPLCRQDLLLVDRVYRCAAGHSFDRAREGYVNLLLRRPGPSVGDSREMLAARAAFLGAGHYQPLSDAVNREVLARLAERGVGAVLDVGCGTGYYLARLRRAAEGASPPCALELAGVDVARDAVRLAARACPGATFVVADAWRLLPVADGVVDVLLSVFSPHNPDEFARVLAGDGILLVAGPEPHHLRELRSLPGFLSVPEDKRETLLAKMAGRFRLDHEAVIEFSLRLRPDGLRQLAAMTPSARHLAADAPAALDQLAPASVTAAFRVLVFRKASASS